MARFPAIMYKDYLKSKHWKDIKSQVYQQKRYQCYFCNEKKNLQIHHVSYENIGKEKIDDLIYLCPKHHNYVTFSKEKEVVQKWLERIRKRNLRQRLEYHGKLKPISNKYRYRPKRIKFQKHHQSKNYAGLFTWKANELK